MKKAAFAIALLIGGAAIAQPMTAETDLTPDTSTAVQPDAVQPEGAPLDPVVDTTASQSATVQTSTSIDQSMTRTDMAGMTPASASIVQPSNASPERDARGIVVLSDAATVPAGWNSAAGTATGGPLLDTAGQPMTADPYPACSASVTDNCVQTYEKGRSS